MKKRSKKLLLLRVCGMIDFVSFLYHLHQGKQDFIKKSTKNTRNTESNEPSMHLHSFSVFFVFFVNLVIKLLSPGGVHLKPIFAVTI